MTDVQRIRDLTGQRFGRLVALRPLPLRLNRQVVWECRCDCGRTTAIRSSGLVTQTRSCGCGLVANQGRPARDLAGKRFGFLVAIRRVEGHSRSGALWECRCDCGRVKVIPAGYLRRVRSCGCRQYRRRVPITSESKDMANLEQLTGAARDGNDLLMLADALEEAGRDGPAATARRLAGWLLEADRLEAAGAWEDAAWLRLNRGGRPLAHAHGVTRHGYHCRPLSAGRITVSGHGEYWAWHPLGNHPCWLTHSAGGTGLVPCPPTPEVCLAVRDAGLAAARRACTDLHG